jgi:hypothetical protein
MAYPYVVTSPGLGLDFPKLSSQYGLLTVREIVSGTGGLALAQRLKRMLSRAFSGSQSGLTACDSY